MATAIYSTQLRKGFLSELSYQQTQTIAMNPVQIIAKKIRADHN